LFAERDLDRVANHRLVDDDAVLRHEEPGTHTQEPVGPALTTVATSQFADNACEQLAFSPAFVNVSSSGRVRRPVLASASV
jgi:hypothetical protein